MSDRLFSREEAEALLTTIIPILERLREAVEAAGDPGARRQAIERLTSANGHARRLSDDYGTRIGRETALARALSDIETLAEMGVEVKDPSTGLIDFRHERDGHVVYLCWRLGEPRIEWWHEIAAGFAGRQRLDRAE